MRPWNQIHRLLFSLIAALLLLFSAPALAEEAVYFLGQNLERYELTPEPPYEWKHVGHGPPTQTVVFDPKKNKTSTGLTLQYNDDGSIFYGDDYFPELTAFEAPPRGVAYHRAQTDLDGNVWAELSGDARGFDFMSDEDHSVTHSNEARWADGHRGPLGVKRLVGNPSGGGVFALMDDGSVEKITPPLNESHTFAREKILPPGSAHDILGSPMSVLVDQGDGAFSVLDRHGKFNPVPKLPANGHAFSGFDHGSIEEMNAYARDLGYSQPRAAGSAAAKAQILGSSNVSFEKPKPGAVKEFSSVELARQLAERRSRVPEIKFIREEAKKLGVRVWLFGGTASGFAHYVNWDMRREHGDTRYQPDRFDYDYSNIYRSTQDLDIVMDGNPEKAKALQDALATAFPHFQGSKTAWEVRLLKSDLGDKEALLNNANYLNQHTDSNSTGMIEITDPPHGESVVRDLRDWQSHSPHFLRDVHEEQLHYYFSPSHFTTMRAAQGKNPEILSVIRYLTKAFQYDLDLRPEDVKQIQRIISEFNPSANQDSYVAGWIEKNGKKLLQNAVNIEYAWTKLRELGLSQKLAAIQGNVGEVDSLAWWMNKKPLTSEPVGLGGGRTAAEIFAAGNLPVDEKGRLVVAHEPRNYLVYESITRAHTGEPNVFASRSGAAGETAAYGDGFYAKAGREGAAGTGLHIRFAVDPLAREGTDFSYTPSLQYFSFRNRNAFRVIPESLTMTLQGFFETLSQKESLFDQDKGVLEKMRRQVLNRAALVDQKEMAGVTDVMVKGLDGSQQGLTMLKEWLLIPAASRAPWDKRVTEAMAEATKTAVGSTGQEAMLYLNAWLTLPSSLRAPFEQSVGSAAAKNPLIAYKVNKLAFEQNLWNDVPEIAEAKKKFSEWMTPFRENIAERARIREEARVKSLTGAFFPTNTAVQDIELMKKVEQQIGGHEHSPDLAKLIDFTDHLLTDQNFPSRHRGKFALSLAKLIPHHASAPLFQFLADAGLDVNSHSARYEPEIEKELLSRFFREGAERLPPQQLSNFLENIGGEATVTVISNWDRYGKYIDKSLIGEKFYKALPRGVDALLTEGYQSSDPQAAEEKLRAFLRSYRKNILDEVRKNPPDFVQLSVDQSLYKALKDWNRYKNSERWTPKYSAATMFEVLDQELLTPEAGLFPSSKSYLRRKLAPRIRPRANIIHEEFAQNNSGWPLNEPIQHGRHTWTDSNTPEWHIPQALPEERDTIPAHVLHEEFTKNNPQASPANCGSAFERLTKWWKKAH